MIEVELKLTLSYNDDHRLLIVALRSLKELPTRYDVRIETVNNANELLVK